MDDSRPMNDAPMRIERVCRDCGQRFMIEPEQQRFYADKGFQLPARCEFCRRAPNSRQREFRAYYPGSSEPSLHRDRAGANSNTPDVQNGLEIAGSGECG